MDTLQIESEITKLTPLTWWGTDTRSTSAQLTNHIPKSWKVENHREQENCVQTCEKCLTIPGESTLWLPHYKMLLNEVEVETVCLHTLSRFLHCKMSSRHLHLHHHQTFLTCLTLRLRHLVEVTEHWLAGVLTPEHNGGEMMSGGQSARSQHRVYWSCCHRLKY